MSEIVTDGYGQAVVAYFGAFGLEWGAILKRLLPMMSGVSAGGVSLTVSGFAAVPPNDRHSPARVLLPPNPTHRNDKHNF